MITSFNQNIVDEKIIDQEYPELDLASQGFLIEHGLNPTRNLNTFEKRRAVTLYNDINKNIMEDLESLKKNTEKS